MIRQNRLLFALQLEQQEVPRIYYANTDKNRRSKDGANNMERLFSSKLLSTLTLQAYNGLVLLVCEELLHQCFLLLLLLPIILLSKLKTQQ